MALSRTWTKPCAALAGLAIAAVAALGAVSPVRAATSWTLATSPNPGSVENYLNAVTCADPTHCWAVGGTAGSAGFTQALIERWNGTAWSVDTVPNENNGAALQLNVLEGITCTSATDCWAVGYFYNTATSHFDPLWEYWNGTSWTASTFLVGVATDYRLSAIACADDTHCWAVGRKDTPGNTTVWFQQWNGTAWITNPSTDAGELTGVSCVDATHCWAVGSDLASPRHTLIETWNGTAWTLTTSPNSGTSNNSLQGVSCVSTTQCWAVGRANNGTVNQNLFEHWDGSTWTIPETTTASNNNAPSPHANFLNGVSCVSMTFCWAVGSTAAGKNGVDTTLIDVWDGSSWTLVPNTPNGGTVDQGNSLNGVACGGATYCAAVGDYFFPDPTLILQYQVVSTTTPTPPTPPVADTGSGLAGGSMLGLPLAAGGVVLLLVVGAAGDRGRRRTRGG